MIEEWRPSADNVIAQFVKSVVGGLMGDFWSTSPDGQPSVATGPPHSKPQGPQSSRPIVRIDKNPAQAPDTQQDLASVEHDRSQAIWPILGRIAIAIASLAAGGYWYRRHHTARKSGGQLPDRKRHSLEPAIHERSGQKLCPTTLYASDLIESPFIVDEGVAMNMQLRDLLPESWSREGELLRGAEKECGDFVRCFQSRFAARLVTPPLTEVRATEGLFRLHAPDCRLLHIALHTKLHPMADNLPSGLRLFKSGLRADLPSENDGKLGLLKICNLDLRRCQMVILTNKRNNGCNCCRLPATVRAGTFRTPRIS